MTQKLINRAVANLIEKEITREHQSYGTKQIESLEVQPTEEDGTFRITATEVGAQFNPMLLLEKQAGIAELYVSLVSDNGVQMSFAVSADLAEALQARTDSKAGLQHEEGGNWLDIGRVYWHLMNLL